MAVLGFQVLAAWFLRVPSSLRRKIKSLKITMVEKTVGGVRNKQKHEYCLPVHIRCVQNVKSS